MISSLLKTENVYPVATRYGGLIKKLLLLVTVLPQALLALVGCHLVFLSFLTARHKIWMITF